ncbi:MAG: RNA-binding cell elongation regulator Jag/EloR [Anaerolineaceae bacterium]
MANNKTTLEVIAPTVEEAVDKGLTELGLSQDDVSVNVLDEGKRNLFRFASRQARVRLTVKAPETAFTAGKFAASQSESVDTGSLALNSEGSYKSEPEEALDDIQVIVKETLQEILEKMGVDANISVSLLDTMPDEKSVIRANIEGDDLSFLIGRKSETLNALQYILSLMVSHKLNHWVPIQVDIQNYRTRRESELRKLAMRMADQVIATGRKQYLEPMPANERRIIHMELRDNDKVQTESVGEEPNRKVCIYLTH